MSRLRGYAMLAVTTGARNTACYASIFTRSATQRPTYTPLYLRPSPFNPHNLHRHHRRFSPTPFIRRADARQINGYSLEAIRKPRVNVLSNIDRDGFVIVPGVLDECSRLNLLREVEGLLQESPAGVRGLAEKAHGVGALAQSAAVRSLVEPVLGHGTQLVRSILFNKSDEANWQVAWHQDLAIAVAKKTEVEGYFSWSVKDGVPHVQPPEEILEQMLTMRLHLDPADETNGALWVSPGSHRLGRLRAADAAGVAERNAKHLCVVRAGDALLMRPLILHASRKTISNVPRRVIHLEFAGASLPRSLTWAEAVA